MSEKQKSAEQKKINVPNKVAICHERKKRDREAN